MTGRLIGLGVAVVVVAFGAAFGIGKATAGGSDGGAGEVKLAMPTAIDAPAAAPSGKLTSVAAVPALKREPKKKAKKKSATPTGTTNVSAGTDVSAGTNAQTQTPTRSQPQTQTQNNSNNNSGTADAVIGGGSG